MNLLKTFYSFVHRQLVKSGRMYVHVHIIFWMATLLHFPHCSKLEKFVQQDLSLKQASFLESLIKDDINILVTKIWCIFSIFTQFALVSCTHLDFENKHWNLNWLSFYKINGQNMLKTAKMEKRFLRPCLVKE